MGTASSCIKRSRFEWFRQLTGIPPRCQRFYKQVALRADLKVDPQLAAQVIPEKELQSIAKERFD